MKKTNVQAGRMIDMEQFFTAQQALNTAEDAPRGRAAQIWDGIDRAVTAVSAAIMAGCLCICTLLFFTML